MPQIDFFAEPSDEQMLVRFFFSLGFELVPELPYLDSKLTYIKDLELYEKLRAKSVSFFLWHKDCAVSPLNTFQVGGSGWNAGTFAIHKRQGGPTLHLVCNRPGETDSVHVVPAGILSYYATFKNTTTGEYEKTSTLLRSKYRIAASRIKQDARRVEFECLEGGTRSYWMMPGAYQAIRDGAELGVQRLGNLKVKGLEDIPWALRKAQA